jgi:class 3 adenylate cyclase
MFHFPDPADAVRCALFLVPEVARRKLPPAHVGVHAGPVVDTVGEAEGMTFEPVGPVTLKGVAEPIVLHVARAPVDALPFPGSSSR